MKKALQIILYQYQKKEQKKQRKLFDGRFVAMFHQITNDMKQCYDEQYAISTKTFIDYIEDIQKRGYTIVSPYDILKQDGTKKVVLTFDDVFDGVYYFAYPYLKQHNIPFVIFPTIDNLSKAGYVSEKMLLEMVNNYTNCFVGAHGLTHCNLRMSNREKSEREIIEAGKQLEKILKRKIQLFAYPFGDLYAVGKREQEIVKRQYIYAFGTLQTGVTNATNPYYIPRMNINEDNVWHIASIMLNKSN